MIPQVSIIMGSSSDWGVMENAAKILDNFKIPFEVNALSAHRTPEIVQEFSKNAQERGIKVIIAGASGAAHLPGVIASFTNLPVIGVPLLSSISIEGWDSILSILQMPFGVPVATVGLNAATNAGVLAAQILSLSDIEINKTVKEYKRNLKQKIIETNKEFSELKFNFKTN